MKVTNFEKEVNDDIQPNAYVVFCEGVADGTEVQIHHVIERGGLSYNVGVAVAYLYRAGKKPGNSKEKDIRKAIEHLNFELSAL